MKILELCLSSGKGGLELYVLWALQWFKKNNIECDCLVKQDGELANLLAENKIPFQILHKANHLLPVFAAYKLARYIENNHIDIVHINWAKDLNLAVMARKFCRKNFSLVLTRHMKITRYKHDAYHRWLYSNVDLMITGTRLLLAEVKKYIPIARDRVRLNYLGVKENSVKKNKLEGTDCIKFKSNIQNGINVVLFGRIEHGKGQHILVESIDALQKKGIQVSAWIIGHTMDEMYKQNLLEKLQSASLTGQVHFMDFHPSPMSIMPCFDAVLLTTYEETFGLVMIEAMMSGVLAIGTNAGGVPEIISDGETGLLFEPGNTSSLSDKLEWITNNTDKAEKIARAGHQRALSVFSEQVHFEKLIKDFKHLL